MAVSNFQVLVSTEVLRKFSKHESELQFSNPPRFSFKHFMVTNQPQHKACDNYSLQCL